MRSTLLILTLLAAAACTRPEPEFNIPAEVVRADAEAM
jgi:hypothetical protein